MEWNACDWEMWMNINEYDMNVYEIWNEKCFVKWQYNCEWKKRKMKCMKNTMEYWLCKEMSWKRTLNVKWDGMINMIVQCYVKDVDLNSTWKCGVSGVQAVYN